MDDGTMWRHVRDTLQIFASIRYDLVQEHKTTLASRNLDMLNMLDEIIFDLVKYLHEHKGQVG